MGDAASGNGSYFEGSEGLVIWSDEVGNSVVRQGEAKRAAVGVGIVGRQSVGAELDGGVGEPRNWGDGDSGNQGDG